MGARRGIAGAWWFVLVGCGEPDASGGGSSGSSGDSSSGDGTTTASTTATVTTADPTASTSASTTTTTADPDTGDASTSDAETGSPGDCSMSLPAGDHERMLEHDGAVRRYVLHVPEGLDPTSPAPLLVNMHGLTSNPEQQIPWSNMNASADPRGYVGVYPAGISNSWNAGTCCGGAQSTGVDDIGFLRAMVADIESAICIDPRRVYATGMSNGGHMSYALSCEAADLFAAVAPVAGANRWPDCAPSRPIPTFAFHGVQDLIVPYADDVASIDARVAANGCDPEPVQEDFEGGNCRTWSGCDADATVGLCTLDPMGHCWPGGSEALCFEVILGAYSDAMDANAAILDFFDQHLLPE